MLQISIYYNKSRMSETISSYSPQDTYSHFSSTCFFSNNSKQVCTRRNKRLKASLNSMSSENINNSGMNLKDTELTLGLPGEPRVAKSCLKRVFSETVDLELGNSGCQNKNGVAGKASSMKKESATSRGQVVGWPPVRAHRKNIMTMKSGKYVKVGVDGAPYLRKVDLELYNSYEHLLSALEGLFTCFSIRTILDEKKLMDPVNGIEYVPTYEDKDGDWMLVGDVPWKMFAESCKRVRLMTRSEAIGLAPRPETKCSSSSS